MSERDIARRVENHLFDSLCNDLPAGLDYSGPDDGEELIVTDGSGDYHVAVYVQAWPYKPSVAGGDQP